MSQYKVSMCKFGEERVRVLCTNVAIGGADGSERWSIPKTWKYLIVENWHRTKDACPRTESLV